MKLIGKKIQDLRNARDWTQHELAQKLNVEDRVLNAWEKGEGEPNEKSLLKIASTFGVDANYLHPGPGSDDYMDEQLSSKAPASNEQYQNISHSPVQNNASQASGGVFFSKLLTITYSLVSISILISLFFEIISLSAVMPVSEEILVAEFSLIDLLESDITKYVMIPVLFLIATVVEIVNSAITLAIHNIRKSKYAIASKSITLLASIVMLIASIILIEEITHFYSVGLVVASSLVLLLGLIHIALAERINISGMTVARIIMGVWSVGFLGTFLAYLNSGKVFSSISSVEELLSLGFLSLLILIVIMAGHIMAVFKSIKDRYLDRATVIFSILFIITAGLVAIVMVNEVGGFSRIMLIGAIISILANIAFILVAPKKEKV